MARKSNVKLLDLIDSHFEDAVTKIRNILDDPDAKNSEVLNAADKLIKLRFDLQKAVRQEVIDRIEMEGREIDVQIKKLTYAKLKGDPITVEDSTGKVAFSRSFSPSLKPVEVSDQVAREG